MRKEFIKFLAVILSVSCLNVILYGREIFGQQHNTINAKPADSIPVLYSIDSMFEPYVFIDGQTRNLELIKDRYLTPTYYQQVDPDWSWKRYGRHRMRNTGCVPTSLAMVIEPLVGRQVLPAERARIMYDGGVLNNDYYGAGAPGIEYVVDYYGLQSEMLSSADEIKNALDDGKFVVAAVGPGNFCPAGYTHEIVLSGKSDNVTVYDPLNRWNNGEYSVNLIWRQRSYDWLDCYYGYPFFSIYRNTNLKDK